MSENQRQLETAVVINDLSEVSLVTCDRRKQLLCTLASVLLKDQELVKDRVYDRRKQLLAVLTLVSLLITSAKEVMFSSLFVCLFVSNFVQKKLLNRFA